MQDHDLIDAEHDTEAHSHTNARFLLNRAQHTLCEGEQHVEDDGEAKTPIDLNVRVIGQIDRQVVPGVLVATPLSLQTLLGLDDLLIAALQLWVLPRIVRSFSLLISDVDLVI